MALARPAAFLRMHSIPTSMMDLGFRKVGVEKSPVMIEGSMSENSIGSWVVISGVLSRCCGLSMKGARCEMCLLLMMVGLSM